MAELRDAADREGQHEVDRDDAEQPLHVEPKPTNQHQAGPEQSEHRAGGTHRCPDLVAEGVDGSAAAERAEQVDGREPPPAEQLLESRADEQQGDHVGRDVQQADVQERRRDQLVVPVLVVDEHR